MGSKKQRAGLKAGSVAKLAAAVTVSPTLINADVGERARKQNI